MASIRVPSLQALTIRRDKLRERVADLQDELRDADFALENYVPPTQGAQANKKFTIPEGVNFGELDIPLLNEKLFGLASPSINVERLQNVMDTELTPEERFVLRARCARLSLQQVSDLVNVGRPRVRVIEEVALRKLTKASRSFVTF